jgi:hypothetical protein
MPASAPVGVVVDAFMSEESRNRVKNYENRSCLRFIGMSFDAKTIQNPCK